MIPASTAAVYVIGPLSGPQKIGVSWKPETRLAGFQRGNAARLSVNYSREYGRDVAFRIESIIKRKLRAIHLGNEWFDLGPEAAAFAVVVAERLFFEVEARAIERGKALEAERESRGLTKRRLAASSGCRSVSLRPITVRLCGGSRRPASSGSSIGWRLSSRLILSPPRLRRPHDRASRPPRPRRLPCSLPRRAIGECAMTGWRRWLQFYWNDMRPGGGMPVTYTAIDGRELRTLWTGMWGVKLGPYFIGVVRGEADPGHDKR